MNVFSLVWIGIKKVLSLLWWGWKKFAHVLGIVNTKILLTITYFGIVAMVAVVARIFRADLLDRRMKPKPTYWKERESLPITLETSKRQF